MSWTSIITTSLCVVFFLLACFSDEHFFVCCDRAHVGADASNQSSTASSSVLIEEMDCFNDGSKSLELSLPTYMAVFVDPQDADEAFWWPAVVRDGG